MPEKVRYSNSVSASFNAITGQMTEMSQRKKVAISKENH